MNETSSSPVTERPQTAVSESPADSAAAAVPKLPPPPKGPDRLPGLSAALQLPTRFGDYELLEEIGRGGMGVVYKAREVNLDRLVALKMILEGHLRTEETVERFHREARSAAALDHPNIVSVYRSGVQEGHCFFTMAYVEGSNLKEHVKRNGVPCPRETVALLLPVVEAVDFAHEHGILHRDLKPENVLVDAKGRVRVADFGLAKHLGSDPNLTAAGQVLGTPCYLSPEQAMGDPSQVGPTADVYGLGTILYYLLTGRPPFQGQSTSELLAQVILQPPTPPQQYNPQAPDGLVAICLKCLEKEPQKRYPTATALAAALRDWAAHADTEMPPASPQAQTWTFPPPGSPEAAAIGTPGPPAWKRSTAPKPLSPAAASEEASRSPSSRRRMLLLAVTLLVVAAGMFAVWLWWPGPEPPANPLLPAPAPSSAAAFIPQALREDFKLDVEMLGGHQGPDGVMRFRAGDTIKFRIKTERDAYVGVWTIEADGAVLQLFPNNRDPEHWFPAGVTREVPEKAVAEATVSHGIDRVWVQAATEPWSPTAGQKVGPFKLFQTEREQQAAAELVRGIRLRSDIGLADKVLKYQVGPRP